MAIKIKNDDRIHGITCYNTEYKISQYADDSNLILSHINSIDHALNQVNQFSLVAGPRLNIAKTIGILFGP